MANPMKGEVGFSVGEGRFTLAYDFNALCTMESDLGVSIEDVGTKMDSISAVRTMFRIGLEAHHGRLSDIEAGNLIHQLGLEEAVALIGAGLGVAERETKVFQDVRLFVQEGRPIIEMLDELYADLELEDLRQV